MLKYFTPLAIAFSLTACNPTELEDAIDSVTTIRSLNCGTYDYSCRRENRREAEAVKAGVVLSSILAP